MITTSQFFSLHTPFIPMNPSLKKEFVKEKENRHNRPPKALLDREYTHLQRKDFVKEKEYGSHKHNRPPLTLFSLSHKE